MMTPSSPYDPLAGPDTPAGSGRRTGPTPHVRYRRRRMWRRRRRTVLLLAALLAASGAVAARVDMGRRAADPPPVAAGEARPVDGLGAGTRVEPSAYPTEGSGRFAAADGDSPVRGYGGPLHRYRVEVEEGAGQDADEFAATVDAVLGDPRSWIASGELRVRRVAAADAADFTVYLATPATSERMCAEGGLTTERYTSCRLPGRVIINLARWMEAVPDYGAPLEVYRTYVVNHEVGHELGETHQSCPGLGAPAPVMQQQTYGLDGCVANAWPYLGGVRYDGEPVDGV